MPPAIPALELPIQTFVLGTAAGMAVATIHYHRTGDLERWPLIVAYLALTGLVLGILISVVAGVD